MKMVKHLFDGHGIEESKRSQIVEIVKQHSEIIDEVQQVLEKLENENDKEEISVTIVNIIMCYNSISNQLNLNQVRDWIQEFSQRLVDQH